MLSSFKPRPLSSGSRAVPHGGLGGCVELKNDSPIIESNFQHRMGHTKSRKRPLPIQIHTKDVPRGSLTSPISRLDAPLPATPATPPDTSNLPTPIIFENGIKTPSAYDLWDRCKDNPWLATVSRKDTWKMASIRRQQTLPIELPGSLLLPSQGFAQSNPPSAPPRSTKSIRRGSDFSIPSPLPSLTHSAQTSPEPRDEPLSAFRSPLDKELPRLPLPDNEAPTKVLKPFCLMSMAQLLKILPTLHADEITDQWITAAEREFARLRSSVLGFSATNNAHRAAFRPFCNEVRRFLKQAQVICKTHTNEFKRAQESTDANKECDLLKVTNAHHKLRQAMALLPSAGCEDRIEHAEFRSIKTILLDSIQVTSGIVRNQMTFQLHKQCRGLPDPLVPLLRHFDNGIAMKRRSYLDCIIESDDVEAHSSQEEQPAVQPINSNTFSGEDSSLQLPATETNHDLTEANINSIEVECLEPQDIIDSYFDHVSIISKESDYTTDEYSSSYSDQISELEKEFESVRQTVTPPIQQEPSYHEPQPYTERRYLDPHPQQSPPAPPVPLRTPSPPPQSSLPSSPLISPIPTPPPVYSPEFAIETLQDHYNLEIATRNSQIDDLRYQIQSLEAHNDLLREHIEGFVQQVGSTSPSSPSGKGFRFTVAALRLSLGIESAGSGNGSGVAKRRSEREKDRGGRRAVSMKR